MGQGREDTLLIERKLELGQWYINSENKLVNPIKRNKLKCINVFVYARHCSLWSLWLISLNVTEHNQQCTMTLICLTWYFSHPRLTDTTQRISFKNTHQVVSCHQYSPKRNSVVSLESNDFSSMTHGGKTDVPI